jgi:DNA gyrase subunit B
MVFKINIKDIEEEKKKNLRQAQGKKAAKKPAVLKRPGKKAKKAVKKPVAKKKPVFKTPTKPKVVTPISKIKEEKEPKPIVEKPIQPAPVSELPGAKKRKAGEYTAKDIYVLKGLEPVRKRPAMYIGSTGIDGLHHLIYECLDNAIDEAMVGYAKNIEVILLPQNRVKVTDDGRGIPVEKHHETKKSALETVMTTLHAGGKFGGEAYKVSGGLHGVGVSVVCALSTFMEAEVCRDGKRYVQQYFRGKPKTPVKKVGSCKKTGTTVTFEADPEIFPEIKYDSKKILNHLRQQAYLTKGIRIIFRDQRQKEKLDYTFYFDGGITSYIKYLIEGNTPRHQNIFYVSSQKNGVWVEAAFQYTQEMECMEEGFANNIYTPEGGTHITGFRGALTRSLNDYARREGFLKEKDENLSGDDVREGLTAVVSVKLKNPQYEGQTKARLGNPEAKNSVEVAVAEGLSDYLERYPQDARAIIENCLLASKARLAAKAARQTVLRKGILEGLALPGKLADCLSRKPEESELYIVEGDSAGGSSRQARDRHFQAILPLRGKILNVERARLDKMLESKEIKALIIAMGAGIGEDFDIEKLRYHRIILMSDADSDGNHIRTLLLTFFYRYFKPVIEAGYVYIAQPPLYKIQTGKRIDYAYTEDEKLKKVELIKKETKINPSIQRYKGLGEMNASELWETTMNPGNRILLQVTIDEAREADRIFDILMGEEVLPRKKFIQTYAKSVKNLDI